MGTRNWLIKHIAQVVRSEVTEYIKNSILIESGQYAIAYLFNKGHKSLVKARQFNGSQLR